MISRAEAEGVTRISTFGFAGGAHPRADLADIRQLRAALAETDVVHVHRGKEHWLAAVANRLIPSPRPIVRTRHIVQAVRPHAGNRWLYRHATALVVTVTETIRRQYLASGLLAPEQVVALPGGADVEAFRPLPEDLDLRRRLGAAPDTALLGMVSGLRVMKGHRVVIEAATRLAARGLRPHVAFIGRGGEAPAIRDAVAPVKPALRVPMISVSLVQLLDDRGIRRRPARDDLGPGRRALRPHRVRRDVAGRLRMPRGRAAADRVTRGRRSGGAGRRRARGAGARGRFRGAGGGHGPGHRGWVPPGASGRVRATSGGRALLGREDREVPGGALRPADRADATRRGMTGPDPAASVADLGSRAGPDPRRAGM